MAGLSVNAFGSINGKLRSLTAQEAEDLQFVSYDKLLTWEGIVENVGQPNERIHLIDTDAFEGHYGYTKHGIGRGAAYTQTNFFAEVQMPPLRRYMPFFVFDCRPRPLQWQGKTYQWVLNIRRYNYKDSHQGLADMLVGLRRLLSNNLMAGYGEPLLFVYDKSGAFLRKPNVSYVKELHAAGFATITEQQLIAAAGGALISVLNPGTAIGYLKRVPAGESSDALTPRHIAVFEDTPERIPPVTGIVTLEPQTPLSHVNLLAKNRGTPNISTARIELVPNLENLLGKLTKMVARADGSVSFSAASLPEAEAFWTRSQSSLQVPTIQANSLLPITFATDSKDTLSLPNIGAKAANYAILQNLLPAQVVKPGFALSFAHYQKITAEPATNALIQTLLNNKPTLSPEEINAQLKQIRKSIRDNTPDRAIADAIKAVRTVITQLPNVPRIRLRSSTNSEDLPTFNGAGLYESQGFNVEDSDEKLREKLLRVMSSLWLERAFWERELFGIDHRKVGMSVLINPAFSDEYGNGVVIGSQETPGFRTWVNAQKGEASVTNPLDDELPESFTFFGNAIARVQVQSRSNIASIFLSDTAERVRSELSAQLLQLKQITHRLYDHFVAKQRDLDDRRKYGIDLEYKLMEENGHIALYVKQSRLLNLDHEAPKPNSSITKAIAKNNGMDGAHLRRRPLQRSQLSADEVCVVKTDSAIGINSFEDVGNGFVKVNVIIPSSSCPAFRGELYVFKKHFNFI